MKKLLLHSFLLIPTLALIGCVATPKTHTKLDLRAGTATITSPKDGNLQGLHVIYNGTNGQTTLDLGASAYNNNPAVITATAAGQAQITSAYGGIIDGVIAKALQAYMGGIPTASTAPTVPTSAGAVSAPGGAPVGAVTPLNLASSVLWLPATDLHTAPPIPAGWRMADNFNGVFCLSGDTNKCFIAIQPK